MYLLFSPLTWATLLALLLPLAWRRLGRAWRVLGIAAAAAMLLLCAPLGANGLERLLETRVRADARCTPADAGPIVLLAGGLDREPAGPDDFAALTDDNWARVRAATWLWRRGGGELWISGGGVYRYKESDMLRALARDWGVPDASIRTEAASTSTWDSAFALAPLLAGRRVRLVTSPWHGARALLALRAAGIDACVQAAGSEVVPFSGPAYLVPQGSAVEKAGNALYEFAGMAWYRLRAARLPRPSPAASQSAEFRRGVHAAAPAARRPRDAASCSASAYARRRSPPIASQP
jgi:uncharacterized SAM-binding protein YcdF (DUF218 family)